MLKKIGVYAQQKSSLRLNILLVWLILFSNSLFAQQSGASVDALVEPTVDIYVHSESISINPNPDGESYRGEFSLDVVTNVSSVFFSVEATYLYKNSEPDSPYYIPVDAKSPVELFTVNAAEGKELDLEFRHESISRSDGFKSLRTDELALSSAQGTYQDTLSFSVGWKMISGKILPHGRYNGVVYINIMALE